MTDERVMREATRLFNDRLYFECHDFLEEAWNDARGVDRSFLKALIEISVGFYHVAAGNHLGAVHLLSRGIERLEPFAPESRGLDVAALVARSARCLDKSEQARVGKSVTWDHEDVPTMNLRELE